MVTSLGIFLMIGCFWTCEETWDLADRISPPCDELTQSPDSVYCTTEEALVELLRNLEELEHKADAFVLVDFHGKDLGSGNGSLSLIQFGFPDKSFIVDAVTLQPELHRLSPFLQGRKLQKVVWDGRLGCAELWHSFKIRMENVLDLQLVYLHEKYDVTSRKGIPLSGRMTALREMKLLPLSAIDVEQKSISRSIPLT